MNWYESGLTQQLRLQTADLLRFALCQALKRWALSQAYRFE
jgi:hypothetical protein